MTTINDLMAQLKEFNEKYNIKTPGLSNIQDGYGLRYKLALEELTETFEAHTINDFQGVYDGLLDQLYILIGSMVHYGFTPEMIIEGFNEVHRSNMSKLGLDGKPMLNSSGKIIKGPHYTPPNLKVLLSKHLEKN